VSWNSWKNSQSGAVPPVGPQPTPPSASFSCVMREPDQGSGADEGVRPTTSYVTNFRDTTLVGFEVSLSELRFLIERLFPAVARFFLAALALEHVSEIQQSFSETGAFLDSLAIQARSIF
jgi:hypothetical protein